MGQTSASAKCEACNEINKDKLFACSMCEELYWCKAHWMDWDPHKPRYKTSSQHQQTPLRQDKQLKDMDREIFDHISEAEHTQQHQQNLPTYWFGVDSKETVAHINHNVYGEAILSSQFPDKSKQYPSLVSFVGATGSGKSTLIKTIINYGHRVEGYTESHTSSFYSPIAGLKAAIMPTSSDVHFYHDPATIHSDRPILFADSEGLSGGDRTPIGNLIERAGSIIRNLVKSIKIRDQGDIKATRSYYVENIYPRILYTFSDTLCYVVDQDPRVVESLVTRMIVWADKARHASLNQVTLPRVILVFNKLTMDDQEWKEWKIPDLTTKRVIEGLEKCSVLNEELQKIADRWNTILNENERIDSVMDLFLRYFDSISTVCIPHRGRSRDTEYYGQVRQLRTLILQSSDIVRLHRLQSFGQMNSAMLESMFNMGLEHFFTNSDKPFDFYKFAMANKLLPQTIVANATYLMTKMRETESNHAELDRRCAKLFSSYRTMKIVSEISPGLSSAPMQEIIFTEPFRIAYREFYASSRCWFQTSGRQCHNTLGGHTKGHQDGSGHFIASGEYCTPYEDSSCDAFIRLIISESRWLTTRAGDFNALLGPDSTVVKKHLQVLKSEREFWKTTVSLKICFSCLSESPDFSLECGHTICRSCVKVFGRQMKQEFAYDLESCPLCSQGTQLKRPLAHFQLKPDNAGVRILSIDGGGVRGVVSARILQMLEEEIGLELPLSHFFDIIIGTSSGGILSLALGANLWSAHKCVDEFKTLAKNSFVRLFVSSIPLVGYLALWKDSYYDKDAIEKALKKTFSALDGRPRVLLDEPYAPHQCTSACDCTPVVRDIKLGVTTVNAITHATTLITNYNRKTSNSDDHGPLVYRADSKDMEMMVWEAARCTSAAPYMFPVYRAKDGRAYQDGGLNENNPIGLAVKEAQYLWPNECRVDVALSIGTGWADERIAEYNSLHAHVVHGWLKRCIDSFENKLDSERLWQAYRQTLNEEGRTRHHRLNTKLPNPLPFMGDISAIEKMDHVTTTYFESGEGHRQLQKVAEALLASLFYVSIDRSTRMANSERYLFKGRIRCRLQQEHQFVLMERLRKSNCGFHVHEGIVKIDFECQESRLMQQELFEQVIQWNGFLRDEFHISLVFDSDVSTEKSESGIASVAQYEISGSPVRQLIT